MILAEYKALSEEDRMSAAINALAQVAMAPTVARLEQVTGQSENAKGDVSQTTNVPMERLQLAPEGLVLHVRGGTLETRAELTRKIETHPLLSQILETHEEMRASASI